ncbi:hypothetical protein SNEBB_005293 [Seison nebaliae]|nr:hypothetical protein SNEBB_005293 [Seison nebaliae]
MDNEEQMVDYIPWPLPFNDPSKLIILNVREEQKKVEQKYKLPIDVLIGEMNYFANNSSLIPRSNATSYRKEKRWEIQIICQLDTFNWLYRYLVEKQMKSSQYPSLEIEKIIGLLNAADYLGMEDLIKYLVQKFVGEFIDVVQKSSDVNCLKIHIIQKIVIEIPPVILIELKDTNVDQQKFRLRSYAKLIELSLFSEEEILKMGMRNRLLNLSEVFQCIHCNRLITKYSYEANKVHCSQVLVDFDGNLLFDHSINESWSLKDFISVLRMSWDYVYWLLWCLTNYLFCEERREWLNIIEFHEHLKRREKKKNYSSGIFITHPFLGSTTNCEKCESCANYKKRKSNEYFIYEKISHLLGKIAFKYENKNEIISVRLNEKYNDSFLSFLHLTRNDEKSLNLLKSYQETSISWNNYKTVNFNMDSIRNEESLKFSMIQQSVKCNEVKRFTKHLNHTTKQMNNDIFWKNDGNSIRSIEQMFEERNNNNNNKNNRKTKVK